MTVPIRAGRRWYTHAIPTARQKVYAMAQRRKDEEPKVPPLEGVGFEELVRDVLKTPPPKKRRGKRNAKEQERTMATLPPDEIEKAEQMILERMRRESLELDAATEREKEEYDNPMIFDFARDGLRQKGY